MEPRSSLAPLAMGIAAGALGGLMGVGGGVLLVPLLVHGLGQTQHEAQGISLAFITVTSLVATAPYFAHGQVDLSLAAFLALGGVPGVMVGARIARGIKAMRLRRAFGLVVIVTAIRLLAGSALTGGGSPWPPLANLPLGLGVGILAGLLGVGGGTLLVPILVLGQQLEQHLAQGVSLLMILPIGIVGAMSYGRTHPLDRTILPALLLGGAGGAATGGLLAHAFAAPTLSRLFGVLLLAVGAQMTVGRPRATVRGPESPEGGIPS